MSETQHAGDCTIYRAMINERPVDGVCTCGYGWGQVRKGDWSQMYSDERLRWIASQRQPLNLNDWNKVTSSHKKVTIALPESAAEEKGAY